MCLTPTCMNRTFSSPPSCEQVFPSLPHRLVNGKLPLPAQAVDSRKVGIQATPPPGMVLAHSRSLGVVTSISTPARCRALDSGQRQKNWTMQSLHPGLCFIVGELLSRWVPSCLRSRGWCWGRCSSPPPRRWWGAAGPREASGSYLQNDSGVRFTGMATLTWQTSVFCFWGLSVLCGQSWSRSVQPILSLRGNQCSKMSVLLPGGSKLPLSPGQRCCLPLPRPPCAPTFSFPDLPHEVPLMSPPGGQLTADLAFSPRNGQTLTLWSSKGRGLVRLE